MDKKTEEKIQELVNQNTPITDEDKNEVWNNIEHRLFEEGYERRKIMKKFNTKPLMTFYATAAAALLVFAGTQTEQGSALVDKIKNSFEPEKEVVMLMEGQQEAATLSLPTTRSYAVDGKKEMDYVIYVDKKMYALKEEEGRDVIVPKMVLGDNYPEVSMEIMHLPEELPEIVSAAVANEVASEFGEVKETEEVQLPLEALVIQNKPAGEWNSPIERVYVIDDQKGGSYVVTQRYFLEAAEGHGIRFDEMLKEFHIVEVE